MAKRIIQVPVDDGLLTKLDYLSKRKGKARAEIIREACHQYLISSETEELEQQYQRGYKQIPEKSDVGESQISMLNKIVSEEDW